MGGLFFFGQIFDQKMNIFRLLDLGASALGIHRSEPVFKGEFGTLDIWDLGASALGIRHFIDKTP